MRDATPWSYDFLAPRRIVFGWGRWREVGPLAARLGKRAFVVLGSRTLAENGLAAELRDAVGPAHAHRRSAPEVSSSGAGRPAARR
jgi:hypothetical protein